MLIKFDDNLHQYLIENEKKFNINSPEIKALNNLAFSFRSGWHIIIGSLDFFETMQNMDLIDSSTKSLYSVLLGQYTFQKSYMDAVNEYILIKDPSHHFSKVEYNQKIIYEVPINYFSDFNKCLKTVLVTEDDNDFEFYIRLTKKYLDEHKELSSLGITFNPCNGGGANSYKSFKRFIREGALVLAIADSDRAYPAAEIGQTLKQLRKIYKEFKDVAIIDLYELEVREKENLIPPSLYSIGVNSSSKEFVNKLKQIEKLDHQKEKLFFLDIKDGYEAGKFKSNQQLAEYYYSLFTEIQNLISCSIEEIEQKEDKEKIMRGDSGIFDQFLNNVLGNGLEHQLFEKKKLGSKIPENVIMDIEDNIKKKNNLFKSIPSYYELIIIKLCKKIMNWGCCKIDIVST